MGDKTVDRHSWQVVEISRAEYNTPLTVDHDMYDVNALWITWADSEAEAADLVAVLVKHGKYAIARPAPIGRTHPNPYALLPGRPGRGLTREQIESLDF